MRRSSLHYPLQGPNRTTDQEGRLQQSPRHCGINAEWNTKELMLQEEQCLSCMPIQAVAHNDLLHGPSAS